MAISVNLSQEQYNKRQERLGGKRSDTAHFYSYFHLSDETLEGLGCEFTGFGWAFSDLDLDYDSVFDFPEVKRYRDWMVSEIGLENVEHDVKAQIFDDRLDLTISLPAKEVCFTSNSEQVALSGRIEVY